MATSATEVFDLFSATVNDYQLTSLFTTSGSETYNTYLEPWLLFSINDFNDARKNVGVTELVYTTANQAFSTDLIIKDKVILAIIMVRYWMGKEVNNVLQMRNVVQDKDFKRHSAAQNLTAKQALYNGWVEEIEQRLNNYMYLNNDWTGWKEQSYDTQ